ncbi:MAG: hypothetical protein GC171_10815 [Terrimonas sp.]|nr:hypothetical protein [Terrimonas sp.]
MNQQALYMTAGFERQKNTQATLITGGIAGLLILIFFMIKLEIPVIFPPLPETAVEVELNLPDEGFIDGKGIGGGGGGNPIQAAGAAGEYANQPIEPSPAVDDAKDIETDESTNTPAILKPNNPKPNATKVNDNSKTIVKNTDKPAVVPAPPKPKAVLGKTTIGNNTGGGGTSTTYEPGGGKGNGSGTGNGDGSGTGTGTGLGSGNGSGVGSGNGPQVTRGDRRIVKQYSFTGDLSKATVYADISVSPDGIGTFVQFARGSTTTSSAYRNAIVQYLRNIRFDKSDHTSNVTVQFNFKVAG